MRSQPRRLRQVALSSAGIPSLCFTYPSCCGFRHGKPQSDRRRSRNCYYQWCNTCPGVIWLTSAISTCFLVLKYIFIHRKVRSLTGCRILEFWSWLFCALLVAEVSPICLRALGCASSSGSYTQKTANWEATKATEGDRRCCSWKTLEILWFNFTGVFCSMFVPKYCCKLQEPGLIRNNPDLFNSRFAFFLRFGVRDPLQSHRLQGLRGIST